MKRVFCVVLALVMMLFMAGCPDERPIPEMPGPVLFLPDTATVYSPDGESQSTATVKYEEGWQNKESFTATYSDGDQLEITYSNKYTVQKIGDGIQRETYYDAGGRVAKQVNHYLASSSLEKMETTFTYDSYGRQIRQESKAYFEGQEQPNVQTKTYIYTDTDEGSSGVCRDGTTYTLVYDHNYRLIRQVVTSGDKEVSRTENTYDEYGNTLSTVQYAEGKKISEIRYTYKAVEVSEDTAARFPQFNRDK
ncbi:MAG: hypothetical protein E7468_02510 [Ruminococcaceae bacterium]|nr:hypothetical protein [Oscillospiraceae bacterium]